MAQIALTSKLLLGVMYSSIAAAILVAVMFAAPAKTPHQSMVFLGGQEVIVVVADTPALREQGLSGRKRLDTNEGLLFVFPESQQYGFWMKDMRFPIDIIWFDRDRKIVDVWEHATPESYPKIFTPSASAQFVLEVPAGFFVEHYLKVGDTLEILR